MSINVGVDSGRTIARYGRRVLFLFGLAMVLPVSGAQAADACLPDPDDSGLILCEGTVADQFGMPPDAHTLINSGILEKDLWVPDSGITQTISNTGSIGGDKPTGFGQYLRLGAGDKVISNSGEILSGIRNLDLARYFGELESAVLEDLASLNTVAVDNTGMIGLIELGAGIDSIVNRGLIGGLVDHRVTVVGFTAATLLGDSSDEYVTTLGGAITKIGGSLDITNSGRIEGNFLDLDTSLANGRLGTFDPSREDVPVPAIRLSGGFLHLVNEAGGVVIAADPNDSSSFAILTPEFDYAVTYDPITGVATRTLLAGSFDDIIENAGLIEGPVSLGAGFDTVINTGTITGSIGFGGRALFTNSGLVDSPAQIIDDGSGGILRLGDWVVTAEIDPFAAPSVFTNSGTIRAAGDNGAGFSIDWDNNRYFIGQFSAQHESKVTIHNAPGGTISTTGNGDEFSDGVGAIVYFHDFELPDLTFVDIAVDAVLTFIGEIFNDAGALIETTGVNTSAIYINSDVEIQTSAALPPQLTVNNIIRVENAGTVATSGSNSHGILMELEQDSSDVPDPTAVSILYDISVLNSGDITTSAAGSAGIAMRFLPDDGDTNVLLGPSLIEGISITNIGRIETTGADSNGIDFTFDQLGFGFLDGGRTLLPSVISGSPVITNSGSVIATGSAIRSDFWTVEVENSGLLQGNGDAVRTAGRLALVNQVGGVIRGDANGDGVGIAIRTADADNLPDIPFALPAGWPVDDTIDNFGTIEGDIRLGFGADRLNNSGTILGNVDMGDGADEAWILAAGTIQGDVHLGIGDDIMGIDLGSTSRSIDTDLFGDAGIDTLKICATGSASITLNGIIDSFENTILCGGNAGDITLGSDDPGASLDHTVHIQVQTARNAIDIQVAAGSGAAVELEHADGVLLNTAALSGDTGVRVEVGGTTIVNMGTIDGVTAIDATGESLGTNVQNEGTINGAVQFGAGSDTFENRGTVNGDINLGDGNDRYIFYAGATQNGAVEGAGGDDVLTLMSEAGASQTRLDGSGFTGFETLSQIGDSLIELFFSGAVTFDTLSVSDGAELVIEDQVLTDVALVAGDEGSLEIGVTGVVMNAIDEASAVLLNGFAAIVENFGEIISSGVDATTVDVDGRAATVINSGQLTSTGSGATTVAVNDQDGSVDNAGAIDADGQGAVAVSLNADGGSLDNSGSISTSGDNSVGVAAMGQGNAITNQTGNVIETTGADASGVVLEGSANTLDNNGAIRTTGANSTAVVVRGDGNRVQNTSHNTIHTSGRSSDGIAIMGTDGIVVNTGTIRTDDATSVGVRFAAATGSGNSFENAAGGIVISNGVAVQGGDGNDTIINAGTITGDINLAGGDDTLVLHASSVINGTIAAGAGVDTVEQVAMVDASIISLDTFEVYRKSGIATVSVDRDVDGYQTVEVSTGRLDIMSGVRLTADVNLAEGAILSGTGTIFGALTSAGNIAPGNSIGVMNIDGDLALAPSSVLEIEFDNLASDLILVTGTADLDGLVQLIPVSGSLAGQYSHTFLVADGGVSGGLTLAGDVLNLNLDAFLTIGSGQASFSITTQIGNGLTLNAAQQGLAGYLNVISNSNETSGATLGGLGGIVALQGDALVSRLSAMSPQIYAETLNLVEQRALMTGRLLRDGIADARGFGIWAQALVLSGDWDGDAAAGLNPIEERSIGALSGLNIPIGRYIKAGIFAGYSDDELRLQDGAAALNGDAKQFGAYLGLQGKRASLNVAVDYQDFNLDSVRNIGTGASHSADVKASALSLHANAAVNLKLSKNVFFTPSASVTRSRLVQDALSESASDGLELSVDRLKQNATWVTLAAQLEGNREWRWTPRISVAWQRQLEGRAHVISGRLGNATTGFSFQGLRSESDLIEVGAGVTGRLSDSIYLTLGADKTFAGNLNRYSGTVRLGLRF